LRGFVSYYSDRTGSIYCKEDRMRSLLNRFRKEESGQDLIEYALLAAFVALGSVAALIVLGPAILALFNSVVARLQTATTP